MAKTNCASAQLTVDLCALSKNYKLLQQTASTCPVAGVLKANAYGLGMDKVAKRLHGSGCTIFFVATPEEGIALRQTLPLSDIYVLNGLFRGAEQDYLTHRLYPVIGSLESLERCKSHRLPCALHFDTGMNRLGFDTDETHKILQHKTSYHTDLDVKYILSHFACADDPAHDLNQKQCGAFEKITQHFPDVPKSLCNSPGTFRFTDHHYDLVRPGYALYGGNPTPEQPNPMHPVVHLKTRILQTRLAKKCESTGYGASHPFDQDTMLATVSCGYADGFLRSGSNKAHLYWMGQPCPVVGRVSMDLITVDINALNGPKPQAGDWLDILGSDQTIDDLAQACDTIGYELLTGLGQRYSRIYI